MNRGEAINQLNLERKRRENDVWEKWFLTETRGEVTSSRLLDRTNELNKIRDTYDKALQRLNEQPAEQVEQNPQRTPRSVNRPTNTAPRVAPGTENLPENQPLIPGQEVRPRSQVIQVSNQSEPQVVRQAREENNRVNTEMNENEFETQEETSLIENKASKEAKRVHKLSTLQRFVLICIALLADLINLVPFLNILITAVVEPSLGIYFRIKKLTIAPTVIATIIEFIPGLSAIPGITLGVIITILYDQFGAGVVEKVPLLSKIVRK